MPDEEEYARIARRETRERVGRILDTLAGSRAGEPPWREVYRDAHTLAGIAPDEELGRHARELAALVSDARGRVRPPEDVEEAQRVGQRLSEAAARLDLDDQA